MVIGEDFSSIPLAIFQVNRYPLDPSVFFHYFSQNRYLWTKGTSRTCFGGILTSVGWQVTLCDPIWHVSFP